MIRIRSIAAIVCSLFMLTGCETTSTTAVWKDPSHAAPAMKSMFVIGVSENRANRRLYEDTMVKALMAKGVAAQASYTQIPIAKNIGKESVEAVIAGKGVDGVLVTRVLGVDKDAVYLPPPRRTGRAYYGDYYQYYSSSYDDVSTPGYHRTYTSARVETNVYTVNDGTLAWTMQSRTLDPEQVNEAITSVVTAITERMRSDGVI